MTVIEYAVRMLGGVVHDCSSLIAAERLADTFRGPPWKQSCRVVRREVGPWVPVQPDSGDPQ